MVGEKVSAKELQKAQLNAQKQMFANPNNPQAVMQLLAGRQPMGQPIGGMLNTNLNVPMAQNPYANMIGQVPGAIPGQVPGVPGVIPGQNLTAQQLAAYSNAIPISTDAKQNMGQIMPTAVRLGKAKQKTWGVCKNCVKSKMKNYVDENNKIHLQRVCMAKQEVVEADDGIVYIETLDDKGKKTQLIDASKSCRIYKANKQKPPKI